jgi:microcystin-dependent protein
MVAIYTNNARSTLAADAANSDLTITVQSGDAAKFPSPGAGEWAAITLAKSDGSQEIVHCTSRTGSVLTVTRAREGTTALNFATGDAVLHSLTAQGLGEKWDNDSVGAAAAKTTPVDADTVLMLDSAASGALKLLSWANIKTAVGTALGALIAAATGKTTPVDADTFALSDSEASGASKKLTWANVKATIWVALGGLIAAGTAKTTPVDADTIALSDSEASNASKQLTWANVKATLKTYFDTLYVAVGTAPPAGAVMPFAQSSAPTGWLKCNGAAVSRTTYATLFTAIGTTYGVGDGSTTFNLPELRGEFIRGLDDGRGVDTDRALGSAQGDQNKSHTHTASSSSAGSHTHSGSTNTTGAHTHTTNLAPSQPEETGPLGVQPNTDPSSGSISTSSAGNHSHTLSINSGGDHTHTITVEADGGAEARPRNVALLYCIKT